MTVILDPAPIRAENPHRTPILLLGGWAALAVLASASGVFDRMAPEAFALVVVALTVALTTAYFTVPAVRRYAERLGPYGLAYFHVWRIAAALVFFAYGAQALLPPLFIALAGWGDLVAGLFAAVLVMLARRRRTILTFHLVGMADFILAVGTGLTLTMLATPGMETISTLPVALIPLIGVPISAATHIAALHMIAKGRVV